MWFQIRWLCLSGQRSQWPLMNLENNMLKCVHGTFTISNKIYVYLTLTAWRILMKRLFQKHGERSDVYIADPSDENSSAVYQNFTFVKFFVDHQILCVYFPCSFLPGRSLKPSWGLSSSHLRLDCVQDKKIWLFSHFKLIELHLYHWTRCLFVLRNILGP